VRLGAALATSGNRPSPPTRISPGEGSMGSRSLSRRPTRGLARFRVEHPITPWERSQTLRDVLAPTDVSLATSVRALAAPRRSGAHSRTREDLHSPHGMEHDQQAGWKRRLRPLGVERGGLPAEDEDGVPQSSGALLSCVDFEAQRFRSTRSTRSAKRFADVIALVVDRRVVAVTLGSDREPFTARLRFRRYGERRASPV